MELECCSVNTQRRETSTAAEMDLPVLVEERMNRRNDCRTPPGAALNSSPIRSVVVGTFAALCICHSPHRCAITFLHFHHYAVPNEQ